MCASDKVQYVLKFVGELYANMKINEMIFFIRGFYAEEKPLHVHNSDLCKRVSNIRPTWALV